MIEQSKASTPNAIKSVITENTSINQPLIEKFVMDLAKSQKSQSESANHLEALNGLVVISYSNIGLLRAGSGAVQVEARETIISAQNAVAQSIRFELDTGDEYAQPTFGSISYKNADHFLAALRKMETTTIDQDRFTFTEIQFELEDIKVIVFNNESGTLMWALQVEATQLHFNSLSQMGELSSLIELAKSHLETTKV